VLRDRHGHFVACRSPGGVGTFARTGASSDFDILAFYSDFEEPMAHFRKWAAAATSDGRAEWRRALYVLDELTLPGLEDALRCLRTCVRRDSEALVTFATIHASKGLSWPAVVVAEDWHRTATPLDARMCYVALTRAELRLHIPSRLHAKLY